MAEIPYRYNLVLALFTASHRELAGRVRFPRGAVGNKVDVDGELWTVIRELRVSSPGTSSPMASFWVRFRVAEKDVERTKQFQFFPTAILIGLPGFRSKRWTVNDQGEFLAVYQWQTVRDAENFSRSQAFKYTTKMAIPGTLRYEVLEKFGRLDDPTFKQGLAW